MRRILLQYLRLFFILFLTLYPSILLSKEVFKQKEGFGYIYWEDIRSARDRAIKDALKDIVMDTVRDIVESITFYRDRKVLEERYAFNPEEYIKEYRIISEDMIEDAFIKVSLEAVVAKDVLRDDLANVGIPLGLIPLPRVLIMMGEKTKKGPSVFWWRQGAGPLFSLSSTTFSAELREAGFDVIDPVTPSHKNFVSDPDLLKYKLKREDVRKWGYIYGADMIVFGETKFDLLGAVLDSAKVLNSVSASAEIMDVASGEKIFSEFARKGFVSDNKDGMESKRIPRRFLREVANGFILKLIDFWKEKERVTISIEVLLKGVDSYDRYMDFKDVLLKMKERVISIREKRFSRREVLMDIEIKGSPFFFKEELQELDLDGVSLMLSFFSRERIDITMIAEFQESKRKGEYSQ